MGAYKKCLPPSYVLLLNAIFDFQHLYHVRKFEISYAIFLLYGLYIFT